MVRMDSCGRKLRIISVLVKVSTASIVSMVSKVSIVRSVRRVRILVYIWTVHARAP